MVLLVYILCIYFNLRGLLCDRLNCLGDDFLDFDEFNIENINAFGQLDSNKDGVIAKDELVEHLIQVFLRCPCVYCNSLSRSYI